MDPKPQSLDALANRLGKPDPALLDALLDRESLDDPAPLGAHLTSARILADVTRIYGLAYPVWVRTTPTQRDALIGFSEELLAIAVDRAIALRDLTDPSAHRPAEGGAASRARAQRDHLAAVLRSIVGHEPSLSARISAAVSAADGPSSLAQALDALVAIGRETVAHTSDKISARVKLARLDDGYLDRLAALAADLRDAAQREGTHEPASQADIDKLEAVNVYLLKLVVNAFEAAHELDPSIPRLVPGAGRRMLGKQLMGGSEPPSPLAIDGVAEVEE